jgi:hypothetical protein
MAIQKFDVNANAQDMNVDLFTSTASGCTLSSKITSWAVHSFSTALATLDASFVTMKTTTAASPKLSIKTFTTDSNAGYFNNVWTVDVKALWTSARIE